MKLKTLKFRRKKEFPVKLGLSWKREIKDSDLKLFVGVVVAAAVVVVVVVVFASLSSSSSEIAIECKRSFRVI